jgi:hypothetical protein
VFTAREIHDLALRIEAVLRHAERIEREIPPSEFGYYGDEPPGFMSSENQARRTLWWVVHHARKAEAAFAAGDYAKGELHADCAKDLLLPGAVALAASDAERARAEAIGKGAEAERAQAEATLQAAEVQRIRAEAAAAKRARQEASHKRIANAIDARKNDPSHRVRVDAAKVFAKRHRAHAGSFPNRDELVEHLVKVLRNPQTGRPISVKQAGRIAAKALTEIAAEEAAKLTKP